jgi:tetratricopeptide (TPR) repeat protein
MVDVFVSYATPDRERVRPIVEALEREGWSVWWDRQIGAGTAFDREIEKAIDQSSCIIVAWSESAVESEWVRNEAGEGLDRGILVPVALEDVRVPLAFRRIQTLGTDGGDFRDQLFRAVAAFAPRPAKEGADQTPYVGREAERDRIARLLTRARSGEGAAILVSGEAGVGKSRLAAESATIAEHDGFLVLKGSCFDAESSPSYEPFITQLETILRILPEDQLKQFVGESAPELSRFIPQIGRLFPEFASEADIPVEQERRYLLNGISEFLARLANTRPLLMIFDDLHWADESTCVMFRQLLSRVTESSIVVVGTYRDDELDAGDAFARTLRDVLRERLADDILLRRFDESGVNEILAARSGKVPPKELVSLFFEETEGNPFFVEEVYRHLEETSKLFDESGEFRPGIEVADTEVPRGLRLVIEDRLARASESCRKALSMAAVIGREFDFRLLLEVSAIDDETLMDAMDEAINLSAIQDLSSPREARYGFVHEQIRQTLLGGLPVPRRQRTHLKVAEALEARSPDRFVSEIAHHIYQAGAAVDPLRTVEYLKRAGDRALDRLAFENATSNFEMALAVLEDEDLEVRASILGERGKALRGSGLIDESISSFEEGLSLVGEGDLYEMLLFDKSMAEVDYFRGKEAVKSLEKLLAAAKSRQDRERELEIRFVEARAHYVVSLDDGSHAPATFDAYDEAIAMARELDNRELLVRLLTRSVQMRDFGLSNEIALERAAEAQEIARGLGDRVLELEALSILGHATSGVDGMEELFSGAWELKELLESRRDPVRLNEHYFRLLLICWRSGHYEEGVDVADSAIALSQKMGWAPVQYPTFKAFNLISLGRMNEAFDSISQEVADEAHRFGAVFQRFGWARYYAVLSANEQCLAMLTGIDDELQALGRERARNMMVEMLGLLYGRFSGDEERQQEIQAAIDKTGLELSGFGRVMYLLGRGELDRAAEEGRSIVDAAIGPELYAQNVEQLLLVLDAKGAWNDLLENADEAIEVMDRTAHRTRRWRALVLRARAYDALGKSSNAVEDRGRALADYRLIADGIPQEDVRRAFEEDPLARDIRKSS